MTTEDLFDAIQDDDSEKIGALLNGDRNPQVDVNGRQVGNFTPLLRTCLFRGKAAIVALFLGHPEVNVNAQSVYGNTALILACRNGEVSVVEMLLADPRVDVRLHNVNYETPLWAAVRSHNMEIVKRLVASGRALGEDIKATWDHPCTPLEAARGQGDLAACDLLDSLARDPAATRHALQIELNVPLAFAVNLFSLVVLLCDEHLSLGEHTTGLGAGVRFYSILGKVPMELQMIVTRRVFGVAGDLIKSERLEPALRHILRLF